MPENETTPEWQRHPITRRPDGSYVVVRGGNPYHVPDQDEWADMWAAIHAYAQAHPDAVEDEPVPPPPTPEDIAAARRAEILGRLSSIDRESVRPLRAIADGTGTEYDADKLAALDAEAAMLRAELAGLEQAE
jgi:hypothetical protein